MFAVKRRLMSESKIERKLVLRTIMVAAPLIIAGLLILVFNPYFFTIPITFCLVVFSFISTCFIISGVKDSANIKNLHNHTDEKYIADLNIQKETLNIMAGSNLRILLLICQIFLYITIFVKIDVLKDFLIVALEVINLMLFALAVGVNLGIINNIKVPYEKLKDFENIHDLDDSEKECFKRSVKKVIEKKNYISRADVAYIAKEIFKYKNARLQEERRKQNKMTEKQKAQQEYKDYLN